MVITEPETPGRRIGAAFDAWTPRVLKALGLVGFAVAIAMPVLGGEFIPVLFGGSLMAASGGVVGDALNALKGEAFKPPPGKE